MNLWALFGGFVPFPLTGLPWGPSLWGLVSPLHPEEQLPGHPTSLGCPALSSWWVLPSSTWGPSSPSRRDGRVTRGSFHCDLPCWTPLPPLPGCSQTFPPRRGLVTPRSSRKALSSEWRLWKALQKAREVFAPQTDAPCLSDLPPPS